MNSDRDLAPISKKKFTSTYRNKQGNSKVRIDFFFFFFARGLVSFFKKRFPFSNTGKDFVFLRIKKKVWYTAGIP